jgi:hypothetical protein
MIIGEQRARRRLRGCIPILCLRNAESPREGGFSVGGCWWVSVLVAEYQNPVAVLMWR